MDCAQRQGTLAHPVSKLTSDGMLAATLRGPGCGGGVRAVLGLSMDAIMALAA